MTEITDTETIGERVKRLRLERRMSQYRLGGGTAAYVSRVEAGIRTPAHKTVVVLAKRLGVSVHYLETGEKDPAEIDRERARAAIEVAKRYRRQVRMLERRVAALEASGATTPDPSDLSDALTAELIDLKERSGVEIHR